MPHKRLGQAFYNAYRLYGVTHLVAIGETGNLNDKFDFEPLPFRIFPPIYAFYVTSPDIIIPVRRPFIVDEPIIFPSSARVVFVQDAIGIHSVPIADVVTTEFGAATLASADATDGSFCVFSWLGINTLLIAKCDAFLPAVYTRVFGPASLADCEKYVNDHGGLATALGSPAKPLWNTFEAWIDRMPGGPEKLIVTGKVEVPTGGWHVRLTRASPQGFNPNVLILDVCATPPTGTVTQGVTEIPVRFEETPPAHPYTDVTIRFDGQSFSVNVGETR